MKSTPSAGLKDFTTLHNGQEGDLRELLMGQQIHIGGLQVVNGIIH